MLEIQVIERQGSGSPVIWLDPLADTAAAPDMRSVYFAAQTSDGAWAIGTGGIYVRRSRDAQSKQIRVEQLEQSVILASTEDGRQLSGVTRWARIFVIETAQQDVTTAAAVARLKAMLGVSDLTEAASPGTE